VRARARVCVCVCVCVCLIVCDLETSNIRRPRPYFGYWAIEKMIATFVMRGLKNVMYLIRGAQRLTLERQDHNGRHVPSGNHCAIT
jgi:hypothetical protein